MTSQCHVCHGSKVDTSEEWLIVQVEQGMPYGHHIVNHAEGDQRPGMLFRNLPSSAAHPSDEEPGDVIFSVYHSGHRMFERDGNNLKMTRTISLLQSLVGFTDSFTHLDGRTVTYTRDGVTPPGTKASVVRPKSLLT